MYIQGSPVYALREFSWKEVEEINKKVEDETKEKVSQKQPIDMQTNLPFYPKTFEFLNFTKVETFIF